MNNVIHFMSKKDKLIKVFKETLNICHSGEYIINNKIINLSEQIRFAIDNTELFDAGYMGGFETLSDIRDEKIKLKIEVTKESTVEAGIRLSKSLEPIPMALNFASAISVGGGVLLGASAQEEDLCRCSALFSCLDQEAVENYYIRNRSSKNKNQLQVSPESHSGIYTDNIIYSPLVPFFRDQNLNLLKNPFKMSIMTVPAPCVRDFDMGDIKLSTQINKIFEIRIIKMLVLAAHLGHRDLILGAWGCGAFGNNPETIALMFKNILSMDNLSGLFDRITFAIYAQNDDDINYKTFKNILISK